MFASGVKFITLKIFLCIDSVNGPDLHQVDMKTSFFARSGTLKYFYGAAGTFKRKINRTRIQHFKNVCTDENWRPENGSKKSVSFSFHHLKFHSCSYDLYLSVKHDDRKFYLVSACYDFLVLGHSREAVQKNKAQKVAVLTWWFFGESKISFVFIYTVTEKFVNQMSVKGHIFSKF